jgi:hypothetical protein
LTDGGHFKKMRSHRLLALSLCALAPLLAAGCAKSTSNANANNANAASATSTAGATQNAASATAQPGQAAAPGVAGQTASPVSNAGGQKLDACALLTSDEIKAVQGEPVKDAKASGRDDAPLSVSQCFFTTATFNKSVSLEVTRGVSGGKGAREFWDRQFARARAEAEGAGKKSEREKEREREKKKGEARGGEEEEAGSLPVPVKGVGDEAFWAASNVNGTLYARKGDAFVRVSIGGTDTEEARLRKVKTLAQKALARL